MLRDAAFVEAAAALGRGRVGILAMHVVPNLLGVVAVQLGSTGAAIVVSEAALAFVGLGPHDGVSLGGVLDQGVAAMLRAPHVLVVGGGGGRAPRARRCWWPVGRPSAELPGRSPSEPRDPC